MYIHIHRYTHTYTHIHIFTHTYSHIHTHIYIYTHTHIHFRVLCITTLTSRRGPGPLVVWMESVSPVCQSSLSVQSVNTICQYLYCTYIPYYRYYLNPRTHLSTNASPHAPSSSFCPPPSVAPRPQTDQTRPTRPDQTRPRQPAPSDRLRPRTLSNSFPAAALSFPSRPLERPIWRSDQPTYNNIYTQHLHTVPHPHSTSTPNTISLLHPYLPTLRPTTYIYSPPHPSCVLAGALASLLILLRTSLLIDGLPY